ncbi:Nucleotide-binding [Penicillium brevicompactum]
MALSETAPVADMDIDMDLDLGPEPEPEPIQIQMEQAPASNLDTTVDPLTEEAVYEKVHVRGVDEMTTENIKQFARDCSGQEPVRVEWIDDTSANLIFTSAEVGLQALAALTQVTEEEDASSLPPLRLRSAKLFPSHPDSVLQVRSAVKSDRKQARAHEKSRFYLMHPEHDPRERLRQEFKERRRDDDGGEGDYSRRRFDDREHRRRRDRDDSENFSADMYGDNVGSGGSGRERRGRGHSQRELLPDADRASGRLRNRSASPGRDTLEEELSKRESQDTGRRFRERSPRQPRRNQGRELLAAGSESTSGNRELFPNKTTSSYIKKDLIPTKPSNHRRSDAFDASRVPDEGARIRGAARASGEDQGFAIRGGASQGLSIKGKGESVRELFPSKYGNDNSNNAGKELFNDTLEGRGGRRRRAEDMFS